jgi:D-alanyl-D-alanine carboxypeptidase/D-alanyl-D-alanine-endopeptidase (penicillin-binding protein 4)
MIWGIDFPAIKINADKYFIPASNTKLFTAYLALETLGDNYLFKSEYSLKNNKLMIKTMGNPLITENDIILLISKLKEEIKEIIVDNKFLYPTPRPHGWCIDDIGSSYAPPVSEINYEMNRINVKKDKMFPENTYFEIKKYNGPSHVKGKKIFLNKKDKELSFSTNYPFKFFINSIIAHMRNKELLTKDPKIKILRLKKLDNTFAEHNISELLKIMNKNSENMLAEMLLLYSGMYKGQVGLSKSLIYSHKLFKSKNINEVSLYDGSGLSHYNLVSPRSVTRLLKIAHENKIFKNSLSIGSVDGTLKNRLNPRIIGKTGTLRNVQNLSGYFDDLPFSIMLNGEPDEKLAKNAIDDFLKSYL